MKKRTLYAKLKMIFPGKERRYFILLFFLILIGTALDFFGVSLILPLVNLLISPEHLERVGWYSLLTRVLPFPDQNDLLLALVLLIIGIYILKNLYAIYMSVFQGVFLARNRIRTSAKLLDCYMRKPYTFHLQHNSAEVIRSVNTDVTNAYEIVSGIISLVTNLLITLLLICYLILVDPCLTISIVAGLALYSLCYFLLVRNRLKSAGEESRELNVRMVKAVYQSLGGIKEVKVMGRERFFVDTYVENGEAFVKVRRKLAILSGIPRHLLELLCVGGVLGLVAMKIALRQDLSSIVGSLSAFAVAAIRLMPGANAINNTVSSISFRIPSLNAICDVIDENWGADIGTVNLSSTSRVLRQEKKLAEIRVEGLGFSYPQVPEPVLQDVSFTIPAGSCVGIVGVTGAGKTTLVDLILGLLEPQTGRILYDGQDIREDYSSWQSRIGYIPQSIYLTDETIRANVALGIYGSQIDDQQVWKALDAAQLGDFVRELPQGLDTKIGERGVRLSGGQRQRIGIARALYNDPEILFLDEATAALDTVTEKAVMEAIKALSREKTCIIIAHRLTTIENCDQVFQVENGTIQRQR